MNLDYKDPFGTLTWLYDVLLEAEKNGEKVMYSVLHAEQTHFVCYVSCLCILFGKSLDFLYKTEVQRQLSYS